jgi:hypothetical protein
MARKRLSRHAPCPCGSGKKYKNCCYSKGFDWVQDEEGAVSKSTPLPDEAAGILEQQHRRLAERFGREPGPGDPVFFDAPPVEQAEFQVVRAMQRAGLDPAFIYAFEKTGGLLVTEQNMHLISDEDLAAWQDAIDEYEAGHRPRRN